MDKSAGDQAVSAYPITATWGEKTLTSTPAYGNALTNLLFSTLNSGQWVTFRLPANAVQGWLSNPASNRGILIRTAKDDPGYVSGMYPNRDMAIFSSKEDANSAFRPKLTLTYAPPASPNVRPLVGIASPEDNAVFAPGQEVPIVVNSSDPDGVVTNVKVYAGSTLLGQYTHAACTNLWSTWTGGSTTLTAVAYDNGGSAATSAPVVVRRRATAYFADMNTDPGWTLQSGWAYGRPTGTGPMTHGGGYPDPASGFTGANVVGYKLDGCFSTLSSTVYATTPAIDCRGYGNVTLEFHVWLGTFYASNVARVQVSSDAVTWTTVWANSGTYSGAGWWYANINISSYASGKPVVCVRWVQGATTSHNGYNFCGWNVDDVRITGDATVTTDVQTLTLEEGTNATFSVKFSQPPPGSTTVSVTRVSGDSDIQVVNGATLVFGTNTWNVWQPVTVSAATDADSSNDTAVLRCSVGTLAQDVSVLATDATCVPPGSVAASDGTVKDCVRVAWSGVSPAKWYEVWRNAANQTNTATRIADRVAATRYDDTTAGNATNYYWIKSVNPVSASAFSAVDSGYVWPSCLKWGYKAKIEFSGYNRGEPLTNFPLLVVLDTSLPGFAYRQLASPTNGGDLRFADANETVLLNHEIDSWKPAGSDSSCVWVQAPVLASNAYIWAYWGNPLRTTPPPCTTNGTVWSEGFRGVWHLTETTGPHRSSTPIPASSELVQVTTQGAAAGLVGGADRFDGIDDYVDLPNLGILTQATVECWANLNGTPGGAQNGLVSSDPWSAGVCHFSTSSNLNVIAAISGGGTLDSGVGRVATGAWFHAAYTVAGSGSSDLKLYLNGAQRASGAGSSANDLTDANIGREYNGGYLDATVDEVRISAVSRSSNWVWASCMTMASNRPFLNYRPVTTNTMTLTVVSAVASTVPAAGLHEYRYGQSVTGRVVSPLIDGRTRYTAAQWRMTACEEAPVSGAGTNVVFAMNKDMTLTWLWDTQHLFTATNCGPGAISGPTWLWCAPGEVVAVTGVASNYYHFVNWSGDISPAAGVSNPVSVAVIQPCSLTANFAENLAAYGTPHWWLAQYGWTSNFNAWALADPDSDGMTNWQEAVAGTDPTAWAAKLMVTNAGTAGGAGFVLSWPSVSGRVYHVERCTNLMGSGFEMVATNLPASPPVNVYTDSAPEGVNFYQIKAEKGR